MWALLPLLLVVPGSAQCLPDAIPSAQRRELVSGAETLGVGVWVNNWPAGQIVSRLAVTLIQERLGFNTTEGLGAGTPVAIYAMMGCNDPTNISDRGCRGEASGFHLVLEAWVEDYPELWRESQLNVATAPRNLGSMGYEGRTSVYVPKPIVEDAYFGQGLSLGYYRSYNVSWNHAQRYFAQISSIDRQKIMPCADTRMADSTIMKLYVEMTGDLDGVVKVGETYTAKCPDGYFWLPPACRINEDCFPFFTGGTGWDIEGYLQKATAWNMPMALAVAASWNDYLSLPLEVKSLFYWWVPDPSFLSLQPEEVMFPTFNRLNWFAGDRTSASPDIPIEKVVSQDLVALAPTVEAFVQKLRIEMSSLNDIMRAQLEMNLDVANASCQWLLENEDLWKSWLPDETECFPGFGLYHVNGLYVSDRSDPRGLKCQACPSGTFSSKLTDNVGVTYICVACPLGSSQKSGASLACEECREGEYQNETGSRNCKPCGVGQYQDLRGRDRCRTCPNATTTLGIGSASLLDCGCVRGEIDISEVAGEPVCTPCLEGLDCPRLSSITSLRSGVAVSASSLVDLGPEHVPRLEEGYKSEQQNPLVVFRCGQARHCPGGRPGTCGGGRLGLACGACPAGSTWTGEVCVTCGREGGWWVLGCILAALVLLALPKLLIPGLAKPTASHIFTFSCAMGLLAHHLQVLGVLGTSSLTWPSQLEGLMDLSKVLILEQESSGLACLWGGYGSAPYVVSTLIFPAALLWLGLGYLLSRLLPHKLRLQPAKFLNAAGQLLQVSFTIMGTMALAPLMCVHHPSDKVSLLRYPNILCGSPEHLAMLPAGLFLLTESLLFLALCGYLAWTMPSKASRGSKMHFSSARFLFFKFRPDRWWFGVPLLLKGLALSLPLVAAGDDPELQGFLLVLVLEICLAGDCLAWPWKVPILNFMDCQAAATLLLYVACSSKGAEIFVVVLLGVSAMLLLGSCLVALVAALATIMGVQVTWLELILVFRRMPSSEELVKELQQVASCLSQQDGLETRVDRLVFSDLKLIMDSISLLEAELLGSSRNTHRLSRAVTALQEAPSRKDAESSNAHAAAAATCSQSPDLEGRALQNDVEEQSKAQAQLSDDRASQLQEASSEQPGPIIQTEL